MRQSQIGSARSSVGKASGLAPVGHPFRAFCVWRHGAKRAKTRDFRGSCKLFRPGRSSAGTANGVGAVWFNPANRNYGGENYTPK